MKPGIYEMSNRDYRAAPGFHFSGLKEFLRSPAHYWHYKQFGRVATEDMKKGTALHTAVLEPQKFAEEIAIAPTDGPKKPTKAQLNAEKPSKKARASIMFWEEFEANSIGKTIITAKSHEQVLGMTAAVESHPEAQRIFASGYAETSVFAKDPKYSFMWKVRPDWITPDGAVVDLKSCQDASPEGFQKQIGSYQYHIQAALYMRVLTWATGRDHKHWFFVAVEKEPPHCCAVYALDDFRSLDSANLKIDRARRRYAWCLDWDEWHGYGDEIKSIGAPKWAL